MSVTPPVGFGIDPRSGDLESRGMEWAGIGRLPVLGLLPAMGKP